ncbi:DUF4870 domain-containing protein [Chloroflexota bacterium]
MKEGASSATGLKTNVASTLAYLGVWISGIVFVVLETKDRVVRFHAMQSIILFAGLHLLLLAMAVLRAFFGAAVWSGSMMPLELTFLVLQNLLVAFSIALWILLMVKAYQEERLVLPLVGELAVWALHRVDGSARDEDYLPGLRAKRERRRGRDEDGFRVADTHTGRVAGSIAAIVWSLFIFIMFNFFPEYVAFYNGAGSDGVNQLLRYPILTGELPRVLPVLNATLGITVFGHLVALVVDKYPLRETVEILIHAMGLVTALVFLKVFPFNFADLPIGDAVNALPTLAVVVLVIAAIANGIEMLTRLLRLIGYLTSRA